MMEFFLIRFIAYVIVIFTVSLTTRSRRIVVGAWILSAIIYGFAQQGVGAFALGSAVAAAVSPEIIVATIIAIYVAPRKESTEDES